METFPAESTSQSDIKHEHYHSADLEFHVTSSSLSSHLVITQFEVDHRVHSPEMAFFQNSVVITHNSAKLSLVFNAAEAILGSIPITAESLAGTNFSPDLYIPTFVQCKDSKAWLAIQAAAVEKNLVDKEGVQDKNLWNFATVYQGSLYRDIMSPSYFFPGSATVPSLSGHHLSHDHDSTETIPKAANTQRSYLTDLNLLTLPKSLITTMQTGRDCGNTTVPSPIAIPLTQLSDSVWEISPLPLDYSIVANKKDAILFYGQSVLFEDELHDNGISRYTVRIRVMSSCYYVLVRHYLRVDNVCVQIRDSRYLHVFQAKEGDYIYRETKLQSATFEELNALGKPTENKDYTEEFSSMVIPVKYIITERLDLSKLTSQQ